MTNKLVKMLNDQLSHMNNGLVRIDEEEKDYDNSKDFSKDNV